MATLNQTEVLTDVLDAFKTRYPVFSNIGTDFSSAEARLGDTIRGRIASVPSVTNYGGDAGSGEGYKTDATSANSLTADVDIVLNKHKHVPIKVDYIDQISTKRDLYNEVIGNVAYALGNQVFSDMLATLTQANFTNEIVASTANSDFDMLTLGNKILNANGANPQGRFGLVNSDVFRSLQGDSRIASGDFYGKLQTSSYGTLEGLVGFENIIEVPNLPTTGTLTGFFGDQSSIVMATRLPTDMDAVASRLGVPSIAKTETVTDPDSGLSFLGITYQDPHTFDLYTTVTLLYGFTAGAQGGANNSSMDKAGFRVCTTAQSTGGDAGFSNALGA